MKLLDRIASFFSGSPEKKLLVEASKGNLIKVQRFIEEGADVKVRDKMGVPVLMIATVKHHVDIVRALLRAGADPDEKAPENWIPEKCPKEYAGASPLVHAAGWGNIRMVEALLEAGADPNASTFSGFTPMIAAIGKGSLPCVQRLLSAGANVNLTNSKGDTALMSASAGGHIDIVNFLLEAGADVNVINDIGYGALRFVDESNPTIIKALLQKGANPNIQDSRGDTPLMIAVANGNIEAVKILLEFGADPNLVQKDGFTALTAAVKTNRVDLIEILIKAGGNPNLSKDPTEAEMLRTFASAIHDQKTH